MLEYRQGDNTACEKHLRWTDRFRFFKDYDYEIPNDRMPTTNKLGALFPVEKEVSCRVEEDRAIGSCSASALTAFESVWSVEFSIEKGQRQESTFGKRGPRGASVLAETKENQWGKGRNENEEGNLQL
ncbi:hypothetical protein HAX54_042438 [Datura stramonium]|uniref:Uncharacterized protein n=1 Tax=Datura stramonium TaxID=4076 RepID=A0ABS8W430_DATST|nr:hypothetical protein [Datura stramonium]